mmetsp:Transcript_5660/g.9956  ORF Transcript_5660/g.9956 Transcript_5660/m.9956 type:complete len:446 (-) Transcript_5660:45-1382(-)
MLFLSFRACLVLVSLFLFISSSVSTPFPPLIFRTIQTKPLQPSATLHSTITSISNSQPISTTNITLIPQPPSSSSSPLLQYSLGTSTFNNKQSNSSISSYNRPLLFTRYYPKGKDTLQKSNSVFEFAFLLNQFSISSTTKSTKNSKSSIQLHDMNWSAPFIETGFYVNDYVTSDVIVYSMKTLNSSIKITLGISSISLEEATSGGILSPRSVVLWITMSNDLLHQLNRNNTSGATHKNIILSTTLCTPRAAKLADSPSLGRDPFISFKQKLKLVETEKKSKFYGFLSWNHDAIEYSSSPKSQDSIGSEGKSSIESYFERSGECKRLDFIRSLNHDQVDSSSYRNRVWRISLGVGAMPPIVDRWQLYVLVAIVGVFGLVVIMFVIVFYVKQLGKSESIYDEQNQYVSLSHEFPETLARRSASNHEGISDLRSNWSFHRSLSSKKSK